MTSTEDIMDLSQFAIQVDILLSVPEASRARL